MKEFEVEVLVSKMQKRKVIAETEEQAKADALALTKTDDECLISTRISSQREASMNEYDVDVLHTVTLSKQVSVRARSEDEAKKIAGQMVEAPADGELTNEWSLYDHTETECEATLVSVGVEFNKDGR